MLETLADAAARFGTESLGPASRLFPLYLLTSLLIAAAVYLASRPRQSFLSWLLPLERRFGRSHLVDLQLFALGRLLGALGLFDALVLRTLAAAVVLACLGSSVAAEARWHPLLVGLLLVLATDFAVYWVHRLHHELPVLWPFHAVHHSAEVLTPVTVYRKHPLYDLVSSLLRNLLLGFVQGALLAVAVGRVEVSTIAGVNAFVVAFNVVGANLRHSHVWLGYGRWLEHLLISPAQHQIHHSRALRHHDRNYGEIFALWDWMFGTLYVPRGRETLEFGLADREGRPLPQPHGSLGAALAVPLRESRAALRSRRAPPPEPAGGT